MHESATCSAVPDETRELISPLSSGLTPRRRRRPLALIRATGPVALRGAIPHRMALTLNSA